MHEEQETLCEQKIYQTINEKQKNLYFGKAFKTDQPAY